jgi:hypothetical protein
MRKRWLIYLAIGLSFGIVDWYFLDLLASLNSVQFLNEDPPLLLRLLVVMILVSLNYGIWLVPVIPTAIHEIKCSHSIRKAALAAVLIWSAAIFSYYTFYALLLMFVGLPNLEFMLYSNHQAATYWTDWWPPFKRIIVDQFVEWIGIAVIGGGIVGTLSAYFYQRRSKRLSSKQAQ